MSHWRKPHGRRERPPVDRRSLADWSVILLVAGACGGLVAIYLTLVEIAHR